ncbi:hypothetical protein M3Y99_00608500 [Aphelenchoides fujianensis]|nr:hypothetical protein M3Y99_00608500 [Aphelenchoides fujianensis]
MSEPTEATAAAEVPVEVPPAAPAAVEPPPTEPPATEEPDRRPTGEPAPKVEEKEAEKADEAEGPPDPPPAAPAEEPAAEAAVAGFFFRAKQCNNIRLLTTTPIPSFMQQNEEADGQMTAEEDQRVFELFQNVVRRQCHMKGMGLPTFTRHTLAKDDRQGLEGVFKEAVEDKRTSVIIILSASYHDPYHMIIKALEQKYDIVTFHLLYGTVFKDAEGGAPSEAHVDEAHEGESDDDEVEEGAEQPKLECPADPDDYSEQKVLNWPNKIVRSVVRKLNCKLGGLCYRVVCDKETHARLAEDEMYLGVNLGVLRRAEEVREDLEEPKPFPVGETIVIMGYSANDLPRADRLLRRLHKPFEHTVNAFQAILRETVARFRKNRGRDPSTVYVFATLHHAKTAYRLPERDMNKIRWFVNKDLECKALVHFVRVHQGEVQNAKLLADKPARRRASSSSTS